MINFKLICNIHTLFCLTSHYVSMNMIALMRFKKLILELPLIKELYATFIVCNIMHS